MKHFCLFILLLNTLLSFGQKNPGEFFIHYFSQKNAIEGNDKFPAPTGAGGNYDIFYHRLEWQVDPAVRYINGCITTYFYPTDNNITSFSFDLIDSLTVDSVLFHGIKINFFHAQHILTIQSGQPLPAGKPDSVSVYYQGVPPKGDGFGSFGQGYHDTLNTPVPAIWTLSEPYGARDWWSCKQDLNDKVDSIDIFVIAPKEYKAAANGILISETINGNNKITRWKHRHPIAAYLIAFAVSNYVAYSEYVHLPGGDSVEILNYVYPETLAEAQQNTPEGIAVMQFYDSIFIEYPFKDEKYGHAQFGWGGGMEHQTMSFMGGFYYELIVHEMAHQWFGDYITLGSWQDIWLNEAFATYCTGLCYEHFSFNLYWKIWLRNIIPYITKEPDGSVFVYDTTSVARIFSGRLSYAKGAILLHMIRWELGDSVFFQAVRNYLNDPKLAHGFARTKDLIGHFETLGDTSLTEFFADWFYGEGHPVYTLKYSQNDNHIVTLTIEQSPSHPSVSFFEMHLPVRFYGNNLDTTYIFKHEYTGQQFVFALPFTIDSVVFDPDSWILTPKPLITHIPETGTAQPFRISPNPATDFLYITTSQDHHFEKCIIYTMNGQVERSISGISNSGTIQIGLTGLKPGEYILSLVEEKNRVNSFFIKQ